MRRCHHPAPSGRSRAGRLTVLFVLLVILTACRPVPVSQTTLTACSSSVGRTTQTSTHQDSSTGGSIFGTTTLSSAATESSPSANSTSDSQSATEASATATEPAPSTAGPDATTLSPGTDSPSGGATARPTGAPTARPTSTPTTRPTSTPTHAPTTAAGSFPYKNYGTFFRDDYGANSSLVTSEDGGITIDVGCAAYGVVLVKIDGIPADKRCKVIATGNSKSYQYDILPRGVFMGIPLQNGNGSYTLTVYEQVSGTSYTTKMAHTFTVTLASSLKPFTAASVMVDFSRGSACVSQANSLCSGIGTATGRVDAVYRWIVDNITYDRDLAGSITSGQVTTYIPNPDNTYNTRKGICFDYAALMCAMLRSQGIPTRLIVGQTSLGYHAWNEVYFEGQGWVVVASFQWQEINGSGWVMFDSTFAAGGMTPASIQGTTRTKQKTY